MIISDTHKVVFLHNPKCAGTTVRNTLTVIDTRANFFWNTLTHQGREMDKAHLPLSIFQEIFPSDFSLLESYFTFGLVRCPYRRVISAVGQANLKHYKKFVEVDKGSKNPIVLRANFLEYKKVLNAFIQDLSPDKIRGWDIRYRHFVTQESMFYLNGRAHADVILKVEDLAQAGPQLGRARPILGEV
jgi:hypothetical protein